jgi:hypothetical protein
LIGLGRFTNLTIMNKSQKLKLFLAIMLRRLKLKQRELEDEAGPDLRRQG